MLAVSPGHGRGCGAVVRDIGRVAGLCCRGGAVGVTVCIFVQGDVCGNRECRAYRVHHGDGLHGVAAAHVALLVHHSPDTLEGVGSCAGRCVVDVPPAYRRVLRTSVGDVRRITGRLSCCGGVGVTVGILIGHIRTGNREGGTDSVHHADPAVRHMEGHGVVVGVRVREFACYPHRVRTNRAQRHDGVGGVGEAEIGCRIHVQRVGDDYIVAVHRVLRAVAVEASGVACDGHHHVAVRHYAHRAVSRVAVAGVVFVVLNRIDEQVVVGLIL